MWAVWGPLVRAGDLGGYITEKALSIDNLFVFVILSTSVSRARTSREVLLVRHRHRPGPASALHLAGAASSRTSPGVLHLRLWLDCDSFRSARAGNEDDEEEYRPPSIVRGVVIVPVTDGFVDPGCSSPWRTHPTSRRPPVRSGHRHDVFAVDSIPPRSACSPPRHTSFSPPTRSPAHAPALTHRSTWVRPHRVLHYGLAAILGFIGFKSSTTRCTIANELFSSTGTRGRDVPEPHAFSLGFIVVTILITVAALSASRARGGEDVLCAGR